MLRTALASAASLATLAGLGVAPAMADCHHRAPAPSVCAPAAAVLGYSDALNKLVYKGTQVGGLSSLAYDARSGSWVSAVDNHLSDPSRIWFFRNLANPKVAREPLVLKTPDGTPYTGITADNEGLAVLPNGDFLVSSEIEPSIRIFGRDGIQKASLPVPTRFGVTGRSAGGEATDNATLEGLTLSPDGHTIVAAMEGALSGDVSGTDKTAHRMLVYRNIHGTWKLTKQIGYRTDAGNRIPEVAFYGRDNVLVEEAAWSATAGNSESLYAITDIDKAADVSSVSNLGAAPASNIVKKKLVANLLTCPDQGAPAAEHQTNNLLDNYEGMAITGYGPHGLHGVSLISDDNFSATQTTRVLNLIVRLPR